jgi:protein-S-isoprenylcysteine O-methyltransferase Ste14
MISLTQAVEACWAVFLVVWAITSFQAKASVRGPIDGAGMGPRLVVLVLAVGLSMAVARGWLPRAALPYGVRIAGLALTILGIGFAIWARFTLGRNWGMPMTLREKPELVTRGPYAVVRHPIYTGVIAGLIGSALAVGVYWFAIVLIASLYFDLSARREERDMAERFPDTYPAYRARTKRLIPFVY